ncbi:MAG: hypothetical protein R3B06_22120 [Kofleriaceae bacterium]
MRAALVAVAVVVAAPATAAPLVLGPAGLALDDGWAAVAVDGQATATHGDARLALVRYDVPNLEAWRERTRAAHVEAIVAGLAAAPGAKVLTRATSRTGVAAVPTVDVVLRRRGPAGDEVVAVRALLFRTTTIIVLAASPADRPLVEAAARALVPAS